MLTALKDEFRAIRARDPAARGTLEILLCYPGLHAVAAYRAASWMWRHRLGFPARLLSHLARFLTGIEIHPGARIGRRFFIDHGMGVVIGETSEIGDDCFLYQGVTLGGTSLEAGKRHPTLGDGVVVGAGAKVIGPVTLGSGAQVGANAVVVRDVAPGTTVVGIPAREVRARGPRPAPDFTAYGTPTDTDDPSAAAVERLRAEVGRLAREVEELRAAEPPPDRQRASGSRG